MIYDIIVVGGGVAGLMAAIEAKSGTNKVALITKGNLFKSNSSLASGGINAVLDTNDQIEIDKHIEDTYRGGYGLGNKKAIGYMCHRAGFVIEKLEEYGVEFALNEDGSIAQRSFGGGSSKRTCYVGDKTGGAITGTLIKKAKSMGVDFVVNNFIMNITQLDNRISGVVSIRRIDSSVVVYPAKAVILAGGGYGGIYRGYSTNAPDYTGDLHAVALRAGLRLKDMEFVQFHPTGLAKGSYLVSEAASGEGGYLVNSLGDRFVDELETRDVVSRAILREFEKGHEVFIDLRHLSLQTIETTLPSLYKSAYNMMGINVSTELLPIKPLAHYTMGGIESDMTQTTIKGLFVCGECAAVGVHGANRLGGNSLLEGVVFGELAGQKALKYIQNRKLLPIDYNIVAHDQRIVDTIFDMDTTKNFNAMRISLGKSMFEDCGITKSEAKLIKAYDYIRYLQSEVNTLHCIDKGRTNNVELISILELKNALEVAQTVILASMERKESRGANHREDYPTMDEKMQGSIRVYQPIKGYYRLIFMNDGWLDKLRRFFRE